MTDATASFGQVISNKVVINAAVAKVWAALTRPELMKQWMSEWNIAIITDWQPGSPVWIGGDMHGIVFENKGTVLKFEEGRVLSYSHLSSLSGLADAPHNYTMLTFILRPEGDHTRLELILERFPTESIYRHFAFYWRVSLELLKQFAERS